jgi:carboxyl-terminal processing protease
MRHHIASLILVFAAAAPTASAQDVGTRPAGWPSTEPPALQILDSAVSAISTMHMNAFTDSVLWEAAIDGLIEALDDPYAELFTAVESDAWEEETSGNYSGIGLQITPLNEQVTVTAVFRSTPANQVGIVVGDVIVGVNGNDASGWTTGMAADSIRGPSGTDVLVKIKRQGFDEPIQFNITRAQVHVPAVDFGFLEGGIGYVVLDRVARNAAREMRDALLQMESAPGLVIDLRRNPGGFLDESLMLADLFLKPGSKLASTVQRVRGDSAEETTTDSWDDRWPQLVPDLPIIILVDEFTASGAEILAGALQDYDRAMIMGTRSFGKGVVQTVMELPFNRRLRFTTGSWLTPLGRSLQRARDAQGRPLEEDISTFPTISTAGGRSLVNGGGIFPDLEVANDTLKTRERELIASVNENQVPFGLRLAEFGFEVAAKLRENNSDAALSDDEFETLIARLEGEGLPSELLSDEDVREYIHWQARISIAVRMEDVGAEADFRMERDPVLSEAARLLTAFSTQASLFEEVDARAAREKSSSGGN